MKLVAGILLAFGTPAYAEQPPERNLVKVVSGSPYWCQECQGTVVVETGVQDDATPLDPTVVDSTCPADFTQSAPRMIDKWKLLPGEEQEHQLPAARRELLLYCQLADCECPPAASDPPGDVSTTACLGITGYQPSDSPAGVLVTEISSSSPASEAGLRPSDVVARFGPREVRTPDELINAVSNSRPGEGFEVIAFRGGRFTLLSGVLGQWAADGRCSRPR